MRIVGKVILIDFHYQAGIIRDRQGRKYTFRRERCEHEKLPKLHSYVSFEVNNDRELQDYIDMAYDVRPEKNGRFPKLNWITSFPMNRSNSLQR